MRWISMVPFTSDSETQAGDSRAAIPALFDDFGVYFFFDTFAGVYDAFCDRIWIIHAAFESPVSPLCITFKKS